VAPFSCTQSKIYSFCISAIGRIADYVQEFTEASDGILSFLELAWIWCWWIRILGSSKRTESPMLFPILTILTMFLIQKEVPRMVGHTLEINWGLCEMDKGFRSRIATYTGIEGAMAVPTFCTSRYGNTIYYGTLKISPWQFLWWGLANAALLKATSFRWWRVHHPVTSDLYFGQSLEVNHSIFWGVSFWKFASFSREVIHMFVGRFYLGWWYIRALPDHEFVYGPLPTRKVKRKICLRPSQECGHGHENFLSASFNLRVNKNPNLKFSAIQRNAMSQLVRCSEPDWRVILDIFNLKPNKQVEFFLRRRIS